MLMFCYFALELDSKGKEELSNFFSFFQVPLKAVLKKRRRKSFGVSFHQKILQLLFDKFTVSTTFHFNGKNLNFSSRPARGQFYKTTHVIESQDLGKLKQQLWHLNPYCETFNCKDFY